MQHFHEHKKEDKLIVAVRVMRVEPHPSSGKLFVITQGQHIARSGVRYKRDHFDCFEAATLKEGDMVVFGHAGAVLPDGTVLAKVKVKGRAEA